MKNVNKNRVFRFNRRIRKQTDYNQRLRLLKSNLPRVVVRRSNKNMLVQFVEYKDGGDKIITSAKSVDLSKLGFTLNTGNLTVTGINDGIRKYIAIESTEKELIKKAFQSFYSVYENIANEKEEPRMNIIGLYEMESGWRIIIFLRSKHRSSHYYAKEEKRILVSPATVDMGGICVTFLENDFNKVNRDNLAEILKEVSLEQKEFDNFISVLTPELYKL